LCGVGVVEEVATKGLLDPMKNLDNGDNHALQSPNAYKQVGKKY